MIIFTFSMGKKGQRGSSGESPFLSGLPLGGKQKRRTRDQKVWVVVKLLWVELGITQKPWCIALGMADSPGSDDV